MKKKILVVGGAGYIGSHVVLEFMEQGAEVTVLDNLSSGQRINLFPEAKFIYGCLHDRYLLKEVFASEKYDAVVHLAAFKAAGESMLEPEMYARNNINGTMNLLEAVSKSPTRIFIFSSTAAVYGSPSYLPVDEKHPVDPLNFYGFTKLEIESFLSWYGQLKGVKYANLRYFNAAGYDPQGRVKGLEQNPANLIPVVMETATGLRARVEVFGSDFETADGTGVRDYIHVSDLASAHYKAFQYLEGDPKSITVNLATGQGYSVLDVIQMTEKISGRKVPYKMVGRREGDPAELYASSLTAKELLGWQAEWSSLQQLISTTWEVYKEDLKTGN